MYNLYFIAVLCFMGACAFNFELTSQRTALENQILGTYIEEEDPMVTASIVRQENVVRKGNVDDKKEKLSSEELARRRQEINRDDIEELKDDQILGEGFDGRILILPNEFGLVEKASKAQIKLAKVLIFEENQDRELLWKAIHETETELEAKTIEEVVAEFVKLQRKQAKAGHWIQGNNRDWQQKLSEQP